MVLHLMNNHNWGISLLVTDSYLVSKFSETYWQNTVLLMKLAKRIEALSSIKVYLDCQDGWQNGLINCWQFFAKPPARRLRFKMGYLKYLDFCPTFLFMYENSLLSELGLILKLMTSQTRKHMITIHTLPNISRSTSKQTMKVD